MGVSRRTFLAAAAVAGVRTALAAPATGPTTSPTTAPTFRVVGEPTLDAKTGALRYDVDSPFQRGPNPLLVLSPPDAKPGERFRTLYLLPVEEGLGKRWGDPVAEVLATNLHARHRLLCVYPAFDTLPWFGRHATDPTIRHERYLTDVVVPLIESRHPTAGDREGRLLVGFSKSGWGATTLLFRNPQTFGFAGAWDAPLLLEEQDLGVFGTGGHFGTRAVFGEHLPTRLAAGAGDAFRARARLVVAGSDSFGPNPANRFRDNPHTEGFHKLLDKLGVKHAFRPDLKVKHHWNTGWLAPVVEEVVKLADARG